MGLLAPKHRKSYEIQLYGGPKDGQRLAAYELPAKLRLPHVDGTEAIYQISWTLDNKIEVNNYGHVVYRHAVPDVPGVNIDVA